MLTDERVRYHQSPMMAEGERESRTSVECGNVDAVSIDESAVYSCLWTCNSGERENKNKKLSFYEFRA